jgi:hypothetical protein
MPVVRRSVNLTLYFKNKADNMPPAPHSDDSSSGSDCSGEELDELLEDLDVDADVSDVDLWSSFRGSVQIHRRSSVNEHGGLEATLSGNFYPVADDPKQPSETTTPEPSPCLDPFGRQDRAWAKRLRREEVYSHRYRPSQAECTELLELEQSLGIARRISLFGITFSGESSDGDSPRALWDQLVHPDDSKKQQHSILLKRGPCLWREGTQDDISKPLDEVECELVLLTHGLVVATVLNNGKSAGRDVTCRFSRAILWSHVQYVQPVPLADETTAWQVFFKNSSEEVWTFVCGTPKQQYNWLRAMERVIVHHHMHAGLSSALGWQYRYVHKPAFSMAVTDRVDANRPQASTLSKLDKYNGYAPLHYAVRCENAKAVRCLLKIGADPNQPDKEENRTPIDYAVRDRAPQAIVDMLQAKGGIVREDVDERGALFGQVAATEEKLQNQRAEKKEQELEQKKKAEAAQQQMHDNLLLMQRRGEQINEMGSKVTELNEGAKNYGSMAKQLKEKSKNSWLPF